MHGSTPWPDDCTYQQLLHAPCQDQTTIADCIWSNACMSVPVCQRPQRVWLDMEIDMAGPPSSRKPRGNESSRSRRHCSLKHSFRLSTLLGFDCYHKHSMHASLATCLPFLHISMSGWQAWQHMSKGATRKQVSNVESINFVVSSATTATAVQSNCHCRSCLD